MKGATRYNYRREGRDGISIRAPNERSDVLSFLTLPLLLTFQSALPMKGATCLSMLASQSYSISIRAPNERSDPRINDNAVEAVKISIRAPNERSDEILFENKRCRA